MKKSFSLIEVLISVTLLSIIISTIFQIKENNIFFLTKFYNSSKNNELISLSTITPISFSKLRNNKIYLENIVDFKDDDIRKELKEIKINVKDEEMKKIDVSTDEFSLKIQLYKSIYEIENKIKKDIYTFKLEY